RLENALVGVAKGKLGVTSHAGQEAVKEALRLNDKNLTYETADGRQKLLALGYPMTAGAQRLKVDAILTGTAYVSPDFQTIQVDILAWDKSLQLQAVTSFTVRTDRSALRQMNRSFVVSPATLRSILQKGGDLDDAAVHDVDRKVNGPTRAGVPVPAPAAAVTKPMIP